MYIEFWFDSFVSCITSMMSFHFFLVSIVSDENQVLFYVFPYIYVTCHFFLAALKIFLSFIFSSLNMMSLDVVFFIFILFWVY